MKTYTCFPHGHEFNTPDNKKGVERCPHCFTEEFTLSEYFRAEESEPVDEMKELFHGFQKEFSPSDMRDFMRETQTVSHT